MPKTYRIYYIDAIYGGYNQRMLEGDLRDVIDFMLDLGHEIYKLELVD